MNTLHRFAESVSSVEKFRAAWPGMSPSISEQYAIGRIKVTVTPRIVYVRFDFVQVWLVFVVLETCGCCFGLGCDFEGARACEIEE
jgi:hypothetical protein